MEKIVNHNLQIVQNILNTHGLEPDTICLTLYMKDDFAVERAAALVRTRANMVELENGALHYSADAQVGNVNVRFVHVNLHPTTVWT